MNLGQMMQTARTPQPFEHPSQTLLSANPDVMPGGRSAGVPSSPMNPPSDSVFDTPRLPAEDRCAPDVSTLHRDKAESWCHVPMEVYDRV